MNTLHSLFSWILDVSLRASLLAGAVLCFQAALRGRISARWRYAMWLPVFFVLVAPVLPESRWSAEQFFAAKAQSLALPGVVDDALLPNTAIMPAVNTSVVGAVSKVEPAAFIDRRQMIVIAWIIGALITIIGGVGFYLATMRRIRLSTMPVSAALMDLVPLLSATIKLRRSPTVLVSRHVDSPAVTGLWRPVLLLPADFERTFSPAEIELVLKHELMHLKRHDLPVNALLCVLQALHWFNPLLWFAASRARLDRESACDAQVLASDERDCRNDYGHALLKVQTAYCPRGFSLGFVGIFASSEAVRTRVEAIVNHHRVHPLMGALAALLIGVLGLVGATHAQSEAAAKSPAKEDAPGDCKDATLLTEQSKDKGMTEMSKWFAIYKAVVNEAQKLQKEARDPVLSPEARAKSAADLGEKLKEARALEKELQQLQQTSATQLKMGQTATGSPAATVDGKVILSSDVARAITAQRQTIQFQHRDNPNAATEALAKLNTTALNSLIDRELVLAEFKRIGGSIKPSYLDDDTNKLIKEQFKGDREEFTAQLASQGITMEKFREMREKLIIIQIMRSKYGGKPDAPTADEVQRFYDAHQAQWRTSGRLKLSTITIPKHPAEQGSTVENQKRLAEDLHAKLAGGADFAALARAHSQDSRSARGGAWDEMDEKAFSPAMREPAMGTQVGQLTPLIEDTSAFIILRVDDKKLGTVSPLDSVRSEIEKKIKAERSAAEVEKWLAGLRAKADIKRFK